MNDNGHHWTSLVLERSGGSGDQMPEASPEVLVYVIERSKCKMQESGCIDCTQGKRDAYERWLASRAKTRS